MSNKEVTIWRPISYDRNWEHVFISRLLNILPSWESKREQLKKDSEEYEKFLSRLKRQHAIETGIIERLYTLNEGVTETFIKEGFLESYLQHGDTNIHPNKLMDYLHDNFSAIDFVFDFVKNNRTITKGFLKELHQIITSHQEYVDAVDTLGNMVRIKLLRGQFKQLDNNPRRQDGTIFLYCPPIHVEAEIEKLLKIYSGLEKEKVLHPVVLAAWLHHGFTQIHPFQDGNGRMARLLASLVLIKNNMFPFTVKRDEKIKYINSLESADNKRYQLITDLFCDIQIRNILYALNWKAEYHNATYSTVVEHFSEKIREWKLQIRKDREAKINKNRINIFLYSEEVLAEIVADLQKRLGQLVTISLQRAYPEDYSNYYFTHQIVEYANQHDYYFNRSLPRGWFKLLTVITDKKSYQLVISIHHYGYDDLTIALGAILEFIESKLSKSKQGRGTVREGRDNRVITTLPLDIKPLTISSEVGIDKLKPDIRVFLEDAVTITLAHISSEIYI